MGANGTVLLDFGAFPGDWDATVDVSGQAGFTASSQCEAYVQPAATADHSLDEHRLEELVVFAAYQADGVIRVYGHSQSGRPLYGRWNVGWVWV